MQTRIEVYDRDRHIKTLTDRPIRQIRPELYGIVYRRSVYPVLCRENALFIDISHAPFDKDQCPVVGIAISVPPKETVEPSPSLEDRWKQKVFGMEWEGLLNLWNNSIRAVGRSDQHGKALEAHIIMQAVENEWHRRYLDWKPDLDPPPRFEKGMLSYLDYRVGLKGESTPIRQAILSRVFSGRLPPLNGLDYILSWGLPESAERLKKMADSIAAFARNAQRKNISMDNSIHHWESDLKWLHTKFYVGRFRFAWPTTDLRK